MRNHPCHTVEASSAALAHFPAHQLGFEVDTSIADSKVTPGALDDAIHLEKGRARLASPSDALLILQNFGGNRSANSARRVTEPRLAAIQQVCSGYKIVTPFLASDPCRCFSDAFKAQAEIHCRRMITNTVTSPHAPAVANVCKKHHRPRRSLVYVLVVLTGNGNYLYVPSNTYDFVVTINWGDNHETDPGWLPNYLVYLAAAAYDAFQHTLGGIDVLGLP